MFKRKLKRDTITKLVIILIFAISITGLFIIHERLILNTPLKNLETKPVLNIES